MLTKHEMREYHRVFDQASSRQLREELHTLEYASDTLPAGSEEARDVRWMLRAAREEVSARKEAEALRLRRLERAGRCPNEGRRASAVGRTSGAPRRSGSAGDPERSPGESHPDHPQGGPAWACCLSPLRVLLGDCQDCSRGSACA